MELHGQWRQNGPNLPPISDCAVPYLVFTPDARDLETNNVLGTDDLAL